MPFFHEYPYESFHEMNLDWIINMIKELTGEMHDFKVINMITWGGLHDPQKEYPRWCIVDTPSHEGYISIKPVPVGITITNTDYWRQVANYSALYADLQNRVVALETVVGDNSSGLVKDVNDLKTDVDKMKNVVGVIIGDSYTTHDPITPGTPTWARNMGELLVDFGFLDEQYSYGKDGTRYTATSPDNFYTQIETAAADSAFDNNDVDYVIIEGGQNERFETGYDTATFYQSLYARVVTTVNKAKTEFPNAKVVVVPMAWSGRILKVGPYLNIFNAIYDAAGDAGAIIDRSSLYYGRGSNYTWEVDDGHPTYETLQKMVHKIGTILNGGHVGPQQSYIVLANSLLDQCKIFAQSVDNNIIRFTITGYNSAALASGSVLAYVYPGYADSSVYGKGTIDAYGEHTANFYMTVDGTYTGSIKCLRDIGAGDRFTFTFEYTA